MKQIFIYIDNDVDLQRTMIINISKVIAIDGFSDHCELYFDSDKPAIKVNCPISVFKDLIFEED